MSEKSVARDTLVGETKVNAALYVKVLFVEMSI